MRRSLAVALLLAGLTGCTDDGADRWTRGADAPVSPRWGSVVAWTGSEVLVVGGVTTAPYPPSADYAEPPYEEEYTGDGAAYDPSSDSWRSIPDAPVALRYYFRSTVAGHTLVVFAPHARGDGLTHRWLAYDADTDRWRVLPDPPGPARDPGYLSSFEDQVYALDRDSRVMVLDTSTDSWSVLPPSPEVPRIDGVSVVGTADGPVVTGDVTGSADRRAEMWDGTRWRRFADPLPGGLYWHWTGRRLVDPDPQLGGGGEPAGGILDVDAGSYSRLPDPPGEDEFGTGTPATGSTGPLMVVFGYLYDDRDGSWTRLPSLSETLTQADGVITGDRMVVFGGFDDEDGYIDNEDGLSDDLWILDLNDLD